MPEERRGARLRAKRPERARDRLRQDIPHLSIEDFRGDNPPRQVVRVDALPDETVPTPGEEVGL